MADPSWNPRLTALLAIGGANRFQPTDSQTEQLQAHIARGELPAYSTLSISAWLDALGDGSPLFTHVDRVVQDDEAVRAQSCADMIIANDPRTGIMLDGHGRLLFRTFEVMRRRMTDPELNAVQIHVADIEPRVDRWHKAFFPLGVVSTEENIFRVVERVTAPVYFNFCSLGSAAPSLEDSFSLLSRQKTRWMISYTPRGIGTSGTSISVIHRGIKKALSGRVARNGRQGKVLKSTTSRKHYKNGLPRISNVASLLTKTGIVNEVFLARPGHKFDGRHGFKTFRWIPKVKTFSMDPKAMIDRPRIRLVFTPPPSTTPS